MPDWLAVHKERLQDAHARARECAERKAAERVAQQQERVYCPPVDVGQLVYLRHRPPGRNKIQDAWAATVYQVVEVQGTTYAVVPLEGGPVKRVHRSNLRPCVGSVPVLRRRHHTAFPTDEPALNLESENEFTDPEFVLVEEVRCPTTEPEISMEPEGLDLMTDKSGAHLGAAAKDVEESEEILGQDVSDDDDLEEEPVLGPHPTSESVDLPAVELELRPVPAPRRSKEGNTGTDIPIPPPRRSQRATAGINKNPFHLPMSACNAVSLSPDVFSQVLTSVVLYSSKLKGVIDM
ncbi:uncharacterized protein LOC127373010 [Dicentrarchus labrax]|uniref:uncharacterized protein LOC127373010 n=1 Tax=Dicentrarchus labrax TaxID=13489 RepID=UPI0021F50538|nr:uncharacterized protein LOC127373010 [Dicentrarchus labrax]XP_051273030.1 uncharacterized protein LOC127373010 [Dicentrarchus labrax]XP_051273031.1 uncharacterized protein LOC127373010 [Dicentrarchus labrax]